jgi:hypothetical protein
LFRSAAQPHKPPSSSIIYEEKCVEIDVQKRAKEFSGMEGGQDEKFDK